MNGVPKEADLGSDKAVENPETYEPPFLTHLGTLSDLTQGDETGTGGDTFGYVSGP